jgi:hypothetical protein
MTGRKWFVRGLVFFVTGSAVALGLLYEAWTNPRATRQQVLVKLAEKFPTATIQLESARLRLLGGIALSELRMARRDDLDKSDFLYAPSAIIYHDKEQLLGGKLAIRKVELFRPRLRVVRQHDGRINLQGLCAPDNPDEKLPTFVLHNANIAIEDRAAPATPLVEINDLTLTIRNDPLASLTLEGSGQTDVVGPVRWTGQIHRPTQTALINLELPEIPIEPALVQRLAAICPEQAVHLRQLRGTATLEATVARQPGASQPLAYDLTLKLKDGSFSHARLPLPVDQIEATIKVINGQAPFAQLKARSGQAHIEVTARDLAWPGHLPATMDEVVRQVESHVEHLHVTPTIMAQLPAACPELGTDYSPTGPVSFDFTFDRQSDGRWHKHWLIRPEGLAGEFIHFRYPVDAVTGLIEIDSHSEKDQHAQVQLQGRASGQPFTLHGETRGEKPHAGVDMVLEGKDLVLDDKIFAALPEKSQDLARKFLPDICRQEGLRLRPMGLADLKVFIHRPRGHLKFANRYVINFHDTSVKYDLFPYPLSNVRGILDIRPDHWECLDFHGTHQGGEIRFEGRSFRSDTHTVHTSVVPASADGRVERADYVQLTVHGKSVLLDREFEQALAPA